MFSSFLSKDMTYSAAIFPDLDKDLEGGKQEAEGVNGGLGLKRMGANLKKLQIANGDESEVDELEEAQLAKLRYVITCSG
jgi:cyclopropane fatty-acyl-phospholipid synthase-like methyltransferase